MVAIFQTTFTNAFPEWKCMYISIKISLKFVPKGSINNIVALVQIMACRLAGAKPLSEPMMVRLPTHICVTRPLYLPTGADMEVDTEMFLMILVQNPPKYLPSHTALPPGSVQTYFYHFWANICCLKTDESRKKTVNKFCHFACTFHF